MKLDNILDAIGGTPVVRLRMDTPPGVEVYAKLELQNLFGMKDRVAQNIIFAARRNGQLKPAAPIIESSSGTMALGIALVGRALGHPVHIVTDPRMDAVTRAKLRALGCELHVVETMMHEGWQGARLQRLADVMSGLPGAFWPQQYSNRDNPAAYGQLARELLDDLGTINTLVGSVGSGGSLCGTARALRREHADLHVVGVDCVGSALFDQVDRPSRLQSGLGNSLIPANLDRTQIDEVHWLNDHEAFAATADLVREQQIFAGNTAGSVYQVLGHVARLANRGSRIVGIFPDRGDRYVDSVFSDDYWTEHHVAGLPRASHCQTVEYGATVNTWSRARNPYRSAPQQHLVFIESNTTGTGMMALRAAVALELSPVFLTRDSSRYAGLAEAQCEVIFCDTSDFTGLRQVISGRFPRLADIAGITSTSEFSVPMVSRLSGWMQLPGSPLSAIATCRDKGILRKALSAAGIHQPRYCLLTDAEDGSIDSAIALVGLPCVVKPIDQSGSSGVRLCQSIEDIRTQMRIIRASRGDARSATIAQQSVLVEEYLPGAEYSVEMFSTGRQLVCIGITEKSLVGDPYFVEQQHVFPAPLPPETATAIEATVRRALQAVGEIHGATHSEVRLTDEGPAVIEINPRLAGGMIPELIRLARGTDIVEQQMRAAAGMQVDLKARRTDAAGIRFLVSDTAGHLAEFRGLQEARGVDGVHEVRITAEVGAQVGPAIDAYGRLGFVIVRGSEVAHVRQRLDAASSVIVVDVRPA